MYPSEHLMFAFMDDDRLASDPAFYRSVASEELEFLASVCDDFWMRLASVVCAGERWQDISAGTQTTAQISIGYIDRQTFEPLNLHPWSLAHGGNPR